MIAQQNDEYLWDKLPVIKLGYDKLFKKPCWKTKGRENLNSKIVRLNK